MSYATMWDPEHEIGCFYSHTSDTVFGPVFRDRSVLERLDVFFAAKRIDPRRMSTTEMIGWIAVSEKERHDGND